MGWISGAHPQRCLVDSHPIQEARGGECGIRFVHILCEAPYKGDNEVADSERGSLARSTLTCAFDAEGLLNPGKVFPTLHRCAELGRVHVHAGKLAFPNIPRF